MLLTLDTSTHYASISLSDRGALVADMTWLVENRHSAELLPRVEQTLRAQRVTPSELDGVAVALGPGSFNGVRAGIATAKGLALALGIPLAGVPTLDVISWGARLAPGEIWAVLDAGRGELYAAVYDADHCSPDHWEPRMLGDPVSGDASAYHILSPTALAERAAPGATIIGEMRPASRAALDVALAGRARIATNDEPRRGAWLAALAESRLRRGLGVTPAALEPLYLRRPAITQSARPDIMALANGGHTADRQRGERFAL